MSSVISVRIKKELKLEAERLGINIRSVLEKALIEELERLTREEFKKALEDVLKYMNNVDAEEFFKVIKEGRRER